MYRKDLKGAHSLSSSLSWWMMVCVVIAVISSSSSSSVLFVRGAEEADSLSPEDVCLSAWKNLSNIANGERLAVMIDSWGKATNDLGKYDECRDLGAQVSQYCVLRFAPPPQLNFISPPYMGTCIPAQCTNSSFADIIRDGLQFLNDTINDQPDNKIWTRLKYANLVLQEIVEYEKQTGILEYYCTPAEEPSARKSAGAVVMIVICFLLVSLCLVGTILEGLETGWWPEVDLSRESINISEPIPDRIHSINESAKPLLGGAHRGHSSADQAGINFKRNKLAQFFLCFAVPRNFQALMAPSPPGLTFLNGVRVISIMWVILGHSLDYMNYAGVINFVHVVEIDVLQFTAQALPAAEFAVDTFFWLSGFLVAYLTLRELQTKRRVNWFLYYFHRIWRLSPAYFFALFFYRNLTPFMGSGPMWHKYVEQVEGTCGEYWWTNVLYVNNFIPTVWTDQCFLWGWYLAVDFQFYIFAPLILLAYRMRKEVGYGIIIVMTILSTVATGIYVKTYNMQWNSTDPKDYMNLVYGKPYTRAAPWLLGIACAFVHIEGRKISKRVAWILYPIIGAILALIVYGPWTEFSTSKSELDPPNRVWGNMQSFLYFTFSKLGWSIAISVLFYTFSLGYGGLVRRFLGANFWTPLARITYSTYLWHPIIMFLVYYSAEDYFNYTNYGFGVYYCGMLILGFGMGAMTFFTIERPFVNLEKLLMPHGKSKH
eukprot:TRINITY_DN1924_c0_g1_i1.p1 TRINITY_DN1924_c0_g1~~TRINITY_DN1924_c0_g1_i1.p1  ORF type:complete len:712 (-),score=179.33 TRINITY_DN1924_c0_g1_i1:14-2149(-)